MPEIRVGQGFDVHPFSDDPGRRLVLGGVVFDGRGLAGHSDADVVAHAVTDALLGAAGLGDIGQRYPDTDPVHAGADSMGLLADSGAAGWADGWEVANVDCTVVLEAPRLASRRTEMQEALAVEDHASQHQPPSWVVAERMDIEPLAAPHLRHRSTAPPN